MSEDTAAEPAPFLRVESGDPTPEELAALVGVLAARHSNLEEDAAEDVRSGWRDRRRLVRNMPSPGPASWRLSARS